MQTIIGPKMASTSTTRAWESYLQVYRKVGPICSTNLDVKESYATTTSDGEDVENVSHYQAPGEEVRMELDYVQFPASDFEGKTEAQMIAQVAEWLQAAGVYAPGNPRIHGNKNYPISIGLTKLSCKKFMDFYKLKSGVREEGKCFLRSYEPTRTVFIHGISKYINCEGLGRILSEATAEKSMRLQIRVTALRIVLPYPTGLPYAFAEFADAGMAAKVVEMGVIEFEGSILSCRKYVKYAGGKVELELPSAVILHEIRPTVTTAARIEGLKDVVGAKLVHVPRDGAGQLRSMAVFYMDNQEAVDEFLRNPLDLLAAGLTYNDLWAKFG